MNRIEPVPQGFHTLTPHLTVRGGAAALDFYARAFGATELSRAPGPDGAVLNAVIRIGDSLLMLNDPAAETDPLRAPADLGGTTAVIHLYTRDCDSLFARAHAAGAEVVMPLADMFWGDRYGLLRDPFGHVWAVATHIEDPTPAQIAERMGSLGLA